MNQVEKYKHCDRTQTGVITYPSSCYVEFFVKHRETKRDERKRNLPFEPSLTALIWSTPRFAANPVSSISFSRSANNLSGCRRFLVRATQREKRELTYPSCSSISLPISLLVVYIFSNVSLRTSIPSSCCLIIFCNESDDVNTSDPKKNRNKKK